MALITEKGLALLPVSSIPILGYTYIMQYSAKEFRNHVKAALDATSHGEEVIITYRGKPKAKLIPFPRAAAGQSKVPEGLFGIWKDREDLSVPDYIRELRQPRKQAS